MATAVPDASGHTEGVCLPGLRVLHVVISLDAGGMERVVTRVARELRPRGFDISVCGLERRGILADAFPDPARVVSLGKPSGRSAGTVWRLHRLLRRIRPDVVHTHNLGPLIYAVAATGFGRLYPLVHGEHCQLLCPDLEPPRLRLRRFLYRACRGIHSVSEMSRQELLDLGAPADRLLAVVNGVDSGAFAPGDRVTARQSLGLPAVAPCIAMVARFEQRKRHRLVIEALRILADQGRDVDLVLAGDGPLRPELQALAEARGLSSRIHFLGFQQDVRPVYHAADLVVLPSTGEGLSNAVLEAMACAVPVLCHDACGCAEAIDNGVDGWVRNIDTTETLAGILDSLLQTVGDLGAVGLAARRKVCTRFDFQHTVAAYERLYRQVAGGNRGSKAPF